MNRDPSQRVRTASGTMTVAEVAGRVSVLESGLLLMREVPNGTEETFEILLESANLLAADFDRWAMVVDLSEVTERPRGRYLEMIRRESIGKIGKDGQPIYMAAVQPGNAFMRTVLSFVLGRMSQLVSVHSTRDAAVAACRDALASGKAHARPAK